MAKWPEYLKTFEKQRLEEIEGRLFRLRSRERDLLAEKKRMMDKAIKRMRRAKGQR